MATNIPQKNIIQSITWYTKMNWIISFVKYTQTPFLSLDKLAFVSQKKIIIRITIIIIYVTCQLCFRIIYSTNKKGKNDDFVFIFVFSIYINLEKTILCCKLIYSLPHHSYFIHILSYTLSCSSQVFSLCILGKDTQSRTTLQGSCNDKLLNLFRNWISVTLKGRNA